MQLLRRVSEEDVLACWVRPAEILEVRYIDWDYWLDVSAGTRLPADAIARMGWDGGEGLLPHQVEPIIVVSDVRQQRLVVIEGHARLTNFVIAWDRLPDAIDCFLGISSRLTEWGCY